MTSLSLRIIVLGTGLMLLAACGKPAGGPPQMPPPEVGVLTVQPQAVPLTTNTVGRLSAYRSADVRARVSGVLLKRSYEEGSDVKQGQVLFQIDPAPLQATLSSALASLAAAQASYTNNHVAAQRARELAPKGYISKSDLDNAEAAERSSSAAVKQARASVDSARINLGYATVRAPIDGRAGKQQVTEGALVGQGEATLLTTVEQIDSLYVNFTMPVEELDQLRRAQADGNATLAAQNSAKVQLMLPDGTPYGETGTLDFSGTSVDPSTGAVALRASIPNPQHVLLPGMYATIRVTMGRLNGAFLVPQAAVQRDASSAYVLVVGADNKVARKMVTTRSMRGGDWVVSDGLSAGDRVIVSGLPKAQEGQPAKPVAWKKPAAAHGAGKPAAAASQPQAPAQPQKQAAGNGSPAPSRS
jgi:membrane fusion protein (multidrug efflux system)